MRCGFTRKVSAIILAVAMLLLGATLPSSLAAAPAEQAGMTLVSGVQVQNLSQTATAHITIKFYNPNGVQVAPLAGVYVELAPGAQRTLYLPSHVPELPSPFLGSAVVESDYPVMATVNTQLPSGTNPMRMGTSLGVGTPSLKAYLPQLMKNLSGTWNSHFSVQNAGTGSANLTVKYFDRSSGQEVTAARETLSLALNGSRLFVQADNPNLPSGWMGGVVVESTNGQPVATMADFWNSGSGASSNQFQSYNGFDKGAKKIWVPRVVKTYYNYNSGVTVQNVAASGDAHVKITFYFGGNSYDYTMTLKPGQGAGPYIRDISYLPNGVSGSAVITSDVDIVAIVNEDNRDIGRGSTYSGILDGTQTAAVFFPQFVSQYYGYASGIQLQNVGGGTATGTATFKMAGRSDKVVPFSIPSLGSWSKFGPDLGLGQDFNGSVVASANQSLVGVVNWSHRSDRDPRYAQLSGDTAITYNGFNLP